MKLNNFSIKQLIVISLLVFSGLLVIYHSTQRNAEITDLSTTQFQPSASTNPSAPDTLSDDLWHKDFLTSGYSYYYNTSTAVSTSYYQIVWLKPETALDDADLVVYSNSGYSSLIGSCSMNGDAIDWIIYRPATSHYLYPKVNAYQTGYSYIEWEDSSDTITVGFSGMGTLDADEAIEIHQVTLVNTSTYRFFLDTPVGGDFDLYLYYLSPGSSSGPFLATASSETTGVGIEEEIDFFQPSISGIYALVVARVSGSGTYWLDFDYFVPDYLGRDITEQDYYVAGHYYFYETQYQVDPSYYQVFWLQPDTSMYSDLYLCNDSDYSTVLTASTRGSQLLDWVVALPDVLQSYYPVIYGATTGYSFIQWEEGSTSLSLRSQVSEYLYTAESVEVYKVTLSNTSTPYSFELDVPTGGDFDLYLYYLNPGVAVNGYSGSVAQSATTGLGTDEVISGFQPTTSGEYALLVVRRSGSGTYTLTFSAYDLLMESIPRTDYYNGGTTTTYYYRTQSTTQALKYNIIWAQAADTSPDLYLNLYPDGRYSGSLSGSSPVDSRQLDWILFRPNTAKYYYPRVTLQGSSEVGNAHIEWEESIATLTVGGVAGTGTLNSTNRIDLFEVELDTYSKYTIYLNVPETADFDLWIYRLGSNAASSPSGSEASGTTAGLDIDERIGAFDPIYSDNYAIVVVSYSGSGSYTLTITHAKAGIPAFELLPLLLGICLGIFLFYHRDKLKI